MRPICARSILATGKCRRGTRLTIRPICAGSGTQPGDVRPPGGESWHEVSARVDRAVARLMQAHPGRDIVAVAHMGVILTQVQQALRIGAYEAFSHKIDNLSVTELHYGDGDWHAEVINHRP